MPCDAEAARIYGRVSAAIDTAGIWHLLADPAARFTDLGPGRHDKQAGRDRRIRSHLRHLKAPGVDVTVNSTAA